MADQEPVTDPMPLTIAGMREMFLELRFPAGDPCKDDPIIAEAFDAGACFVAQALAQSVQNLSTARLMEVFKDLCFESADIVAKGAATGG